jgi:SSS family solute:Na+ symporter
LETGTLISLSVYFLAMLGIGLYAYRTSTSDVSGYMLGGRKLGPGVTALSAGASDMSGWMLMGLPGAFFVAGFSEVWIAIGLLAGAYLNYLIVAPRLRTYTHVAKDSITLPDYFENRFNDTSRALRLVSAVVIIVFFTLYTAAGVYAGGTLFQNAFGLNYEIGLFLTAGVVVAYTLFGGFLAVSMTDFVQGCIMFIALVLVPVTAFMVLGGSGPVMAEIQAMEQPMLDPWHGATFLGVVSLLAWGLGYFGQPHIIVRFMAIRSIKDFKVARRIGMTWMTVALIGAMLTGIMGSVYMVTQTGSLGPAAYLDNAGQLADPETIFIVLSQILFNPLIGGFLLAAILAAIMSTISSQLLVTSSSLTKDFYLAFMRRDASDKEQVLVGRISVFIVALAAIGLSLNPSQNLLSQVGNAWAGFGAAFGPLIIFSLYWKRMTYAGALSGMVIGAGTVLFWIYAPVTIAGDTLSSYVYEIVPGVIFSALAIFIVSKLTQPPAASIQQDFEKMERRLETDME